MFIGSVRTVSMSVAQLAVIVAAVVTGELLVSAVGLIRSG